VSKQFATITGWSKDKSLKGPAVSHSARKCDGSWFHAFGPATANARAPKCVPEEQTTRSPRVAGHSLSVGCRLM